MVCLGVRDMAASVRFYRDGLGMRTTEKSDCPEVIFFDTPGVKLELYPLDKLAEDINPAAPPALPQRGFNGITLAYCARSKEQVLTMVEMARKAGATMLKEPQDVFWGGYHAYFADPDGYCWEIAWNPFREIDANGLIKDA
ncbi:MAG: VOC family protein [Eubacteriales bacterium]|nr:VOC family protein [Eubacteriales bacterium]